MDKIWSVAVNDLRVSFRDRSIWLSLVIIPLVIIFFIGLANGGFGGGGGGARLLVDTFDQDRSDLSAELLANLKVVNPDIMLCPADNNADDVCRLNGESLTEALATGRLTDGMVSATLVIPPDFGAKALAGEPVNVIYRSQNATGQTGPVLQALQAVLQRTGGAAVAARVGVEVFENSGLVGATFRDEAERTTFRQEIYDTARQTWNDLPPAVTFSESAEKEGRKPSGFSQSVPGIGTMYVMSTVLIGCLVLLTERKQWTFQRMLTMPVAPGQVVAGKMLARFVMGMIQYAVAFGFGLILGVYFGDSPLALLLIMVVFTLCCTAFALLLATFVKTEMQAGSLLNLVVLILAPLGGAWWPLEIVPQWMQTLGHLSPVAWAMEGFRNVIFHGGGVASVIPNVLVLLALTAVVFLIAVRRFKYE
ncbi:MAG: ABC transporter permease [Chloroflexi bacterium]|nr:ABC transporter permease [Chloroflexota bacterium]